MAEWILHALSRWNERFANYNREVEWERARNADRKEKAKIKRLCPVNGPQFMDGYAGRRFRVTEDGIVFVVGSDGKIITVFRVKGL